MIKKPLVILTGPTAVGKTALSVSLAKQINGEIISADSMQVYRRMDIGTAKVTEEEKNGIPHHLIDILEPWEEFSVVEFQRRARLAVQNILERGKIPILVGGTGFYIQSLLYGIDFTDNDSNTELRTRLEAESEKDGGLSLHKYLSEIDPVAASEIHPNNRKRVIRAVEFYELTGQRISEHNEEQRQNEAVYNAAYFVLTMNRDELYQRIDIRVDDMIHNGLVDEVASLLAEGCTRDMISMQGLGYKEIIRYLNNEISLDEAIYILKRDTRHFAKRQLTWFRRERDVIWLEKDNPDTDVFTSILSTLQSKNII